MNPAIVVVEGLDGVGKTTLTTRLAAALGATLLTSPPHLELAAVHAVYRRTSPPRR